MRPIWLLKFLGGDGCGVAVHSERFGEGCEGNGRGRGTGEEKEKEGGIQDKRELGSKEG